MIFIFIILIWFDSFKRKNPDIFLFPFFVVHMFDMIDISEKFSKLQSNYYIWLNLICITIDVMIIIIIIIIIIMVNIINITKILWLNLFDQLWMMKYCICNNQNPIIIHIDRGYKLPITGLLSNNVFFFDLIWNLNVAIIYSFICHSFFFWCIMYVKLIFFCLKNDWMKDK